jgi:transcriptional regulator with XRE-family HTH domain
MRQPKNPEATSLYPNNIGRCIKQQGYTQEEVADAIGIARRTLSNYISGKRATPRYCLEKIAQTIGCEIEALIIQPERQLSPSSQDAPEIGQESASDQNTEGDDTMDRRQTLQFLSAAGSLLVGVPALTHLEEIEKVIRRRVARLQTWLVDSLEDATLQRWQLYYTSRNSLTEMGLFQQIGRLEQLADDGGGDESRIYSVLIQNYQLAGSLARDNFHYTRAKKYFHDALRFANEIQSPDLTATAVARLAVVLMRQAGGDVTDSGYGKLVADALELYRSAAEIAGHAEAHVRAYVLAGLAEAQARGGHRDACYRTLDEAEQLLDRSLVVSPEEDIAHVRLTLQSLEDTRGECYVLLGEPLKGLNYLQAAQKSLNPTISRNLCRLLMQQSEAYLAAGYPDQCVFYALQGLHIGRTLESTSNINWSHEIHIKLLRSRWRNETVIGELEAALAG